MSRNDEIVVIIPLFEGNAWLGGTQYFSNLTKVVSTYFPLVEFIPVNYEKELATALTKRTFFRKVIQKISRVTSEELVSKEWQEICKLKSKGKRVVIFSNLFRMITAAGKLHSIFWIPDFQFLHLPNMAAAGASVGFIANSQKGSEAAKNIMLSSKDSLKDFSTLFPKYSAKARVVSFVKRIDSDFLAISPLAISKFYKLTEFFFYVPNQFWKHKNHKIILEAITLMKKIQHHVFVVFSGNTEDLRDPNHFRSLEKIIQENDLSANVRILGVIPYEHVVALIRQSIAVINPSLFEGWSTTVEEIKSIGKRMILSDLDVHKEQAPNGAVFFERNNAVQLADILHVEFEKKIAGPDRDRECKAAEIQTAREYEFAMQFYTLLNEH